MRSVEPHSVQASLGSSFRSMFIGYGFPPFAFGPTRPAAAAAAIGLCLCSLIPSGPFLLLEALLVRLFAIFVALSV